MLDSHRLERGELALVRRLAARLARSAAIPFGDDLAALATDDDRLWSTDMLLDGVHFDSRRHGWEAIGHKAIAVNLSDCAAMAVRPAGSLAAVALNRDVANTDAERLLTAIDETGRNFGCPLMGGDTNRWDAPTVVSVSIAARPDGDRPPVTRCGARSGDELFVTGPLGGSLLGRHLTVTPRVDLALELNRVLRISAMIDVSDGLSLDLARLCEASGVGAELQAERVDAAIHSDAHTLSRDSGKAARAHALGDGEDFELLLAVRGTVTEARQRAFGLLPLGQATAGRGLFLVEDGQRTPLEPTGWEHA